MVAPPPAVFLEPFLGDECERWEGAGEAAQIRSPFGHSGGCLVASRARLTCAAL